MEKNNSKVSLSERVKNANYDKVNRKLRKPSYAVMSILMGLLIGMVLIAILGENPFIFLSSIFKGSFMNIESFGNFLANFAWLLLVGLSVGMALKMGLFNIGVTGQFLLGGITGFFWAYYAHIGRLGIVFSILIPMISGALLGWLIGYLKARHNVNEVLTSIMFNWIVYYLYKWTTLNSQSWTSEVGSTFNIAAENSLRTQNLTAIFGENSQINWGIFIAIFAVIIVWFLLKKTQWGKQVEVTGKNPSAAIYAGYDKNKNIITSMTLSGALAGLGGAVFYLGMKEGLPGIGGDLPGEAFNGISIALIGFVTPGGMVASSLFMSLLITSQTFVQIYLPVEIITLVTGVIVWFIAITNYFIIYDPLHKMGLKRKARKLELETARSGGKPETNLLSGKTMKTKQNTKPKQQQTKVQRGDK